MKVKFSIAMVLLVFGVLLAEARHATEYIDRTNSILNRARI